MRPAASSLTAPDHHILAAAQIVGFLGENANKVASIRFNGIAIDNPVERAEQLKAGYRAEAEKATDKSGWGDWALGKAVGLAEGFDRKVISKVRKVAGPAAKAVQRRLSVWPAPPLMVEGVYERANIEIDLHDGRNFPFRDAWILDRPHTLPILQLTTKINGLQGVCVVPWSGLVPAVSGIRTALAERKVARAQGDMQNVRAYNRALVKLTMLAAADSVPGVSSFFIYPLLLNGVRNLEQMQFGEMLLVNLETFVPLLAGVSATGLASDPAQMSEADAAELARENGTTQATPVEHDLMVLNQMSG